MMAWHALQVVVILNLALLAWLLWRREIGK